MLLVAIALAACSKEMKVKNEFKKWVNQEYADPTAIKEIMAVEKWHTITSQEYKKIGTDCNKREKVGGRY